MLSQTAFGSFAKLEVQYAIAGGMEMRNQEGEKPIALDAYEALAERYAALVDSKAENAYCERPATLSLLPDIEGKRVLDAGCGPGSYSGGWRCPTCARSVSCYEDECHWCGASLKAQ